MVDVYNTIIQYAWNNEPVPIRRNSLMGKQDCIVYTEIIIETYMTYTYNRQIQGVDSPCCR